MLYTYTYTYSNYLYLCCILILILKVVRARRHAQCGHLLHSFGRLQVSAGCTSVPGGTSASQGRRRVVSYVAQRRAAAAGARGPIPAHRDNGKRREVNDYLWLKTKAEHRQEKMDRLEEQKFMRLRDKRERADRSDTVGGTGVF